jgi:hypothetical protein
MRPRKARTSFGLHIRVKNLPAPALRGAVARATIWASARHLLIAAWCQELLACPRAAIARRTRKSAGSAAPQEAIFFKLQVCEWGVRRRKLR